MNKIFKILLALAPLLLSSPVSAQFSAQATYVPAASIGGTANAITLNIANVSSLADLLGVPIRFVPTATNTNAVTVNVSSLGAVAINRQTPAGLFALSNAELQAQMTELIYDGTVFELTSTLNQPPIGSTIELRSSTIPNGYLVEDGSCFSRTGQYAPLFSVIGTTYNANAPSACSGAQFAVPYSNGTMFAANDNQGVNTASRITNSGAGNVCAATAVGTLCGSQNHVQALTELVAHTHSFAGGSNTTYSGGASTGALSPTSLSTGSTGSSAAFTILPPILTGLRAIKY